MPSDDLKAARKPSVDPVRVAYAFVAFFKGWATRDGQPVGGREGWKVFDADLRRMRYESINDALSSESVQLALRKLQPIVDGVLKLDRRHYMALYEAMGLMPLDFIRCSCCGGEFFVRGEELDGGDLDRRVMPSMCDYCSQMWPVTQWPFDHTPTFEEFIRYIGRRRRADMLVNYSMFYSNTVSDSWPEVTAESSWNERFEDWDTWKRAVFGGPDDDAEDEYHEWTRYWSEE